MVESEAAVDLQTFPIDRKAHAASPRSFLTRRVPARRRLGYAWCVGNGKSMSGMQTRESIA